MKDLSKLFIKFAELNGQRLVYMALTTLFAWLLWELDMHAEAKVLFVGVGALCLSRTRGMPNDKNNGGDL